MLISVVIPCYYSEKTIRKVVELVMAEFEKNDGYQSDKSKETLKEKQNHLTEIQQQLKLKMFRKRRKFLKNQQNNFQHQKLLLTI